MKVKLLKKVRKRYRIDYVSKNDCIDHIMYRQAPYYEVSDILSSYGIRTTFHTHGNIVSKENALIAAQNRLIEMIRKDYQSKIKKQSQLIKSKKNWYNANS